MIPYFLEKLKNTPDGDSNLLENTLIIYGSPMGNSNVHNHKRCPLFLAGRAGGHLKGEPAPEGARRHADGQRVPHAAARPRRWTMSKSFGDSTGEFDLNAVPETTVARG